MLRFSRWNPNKSANQEVYGSFDFNKTPLAPLGTRALIYDDPASRASWAPHATDGYYVGPASNHYRCLRFYIPATRRFRFSDRWRLYPAHSQVPVTSQHDLSISTAAELIKAFAATVPTMIMKFFSTYQGYSGFNSHLSWMTDTRVSGCAYWYASNGE